MNAEDDDDDGMRTARDLLMNAEDDDNDGMRTARDLLGRPRRPRGRGRHAQGSPPEPTERRDEQADTEFEQDDDR